MLVMQMCGRCGALNEGDCPNHPELVRADNDRRHRKQRAHGRDTQHWRRLRRACLDRARGRCELKLAGCKRVASHAHLRPELNGNHSIATLADVVASCDHCHGVVDAPRATTSRLTGGGSVTGSRVARPARRHPRETSTTVVAADN